MKPKRVEVAVQGQRGPRRAFGLGDQVHVVARAPAVRHAVAPQRVELAQAELQRVEAEQVPDHLVHARLLPVEQVAPGRRGQPRGELDTGSEVAERGVALRLHAVEDVGVARGRFL